MPGSSDSSLKIGKGHCWPRRRGRIFPLSISTWHVAPSTNQDRDWKNNCTRDVQNHMVWAAPLAGCYSQIARDKPHLQCKHKASFDKPAIILHGKKRRPAFLSGHDTSSLPHVSWGKVCHIIPCPAKSCSWGSPSPL